MHVHRYVDTPEKARVVAGEIVRLQVPPHSIIVLSTLVSAELRGIIQSTTCVYIDLMETFLAPVSQALGLPVSQAVGHSHRMHMDYMQRMEAINFSLQNDDGGSIRHYEEADIILIGVSRSGKTPTSVYLAMHYGLAVANFPLVEEDMENLQLPTALQAVRDKLYGLTLTPERLHRIRQERKADSRYASLAQCRHELGQAEALYRQYSIPYLDVSERSVEEIAAHVLEYLGRKP